ncbi:hypothetical protein [Algiphilus aromaticivorans]|uniref:hypothetical protein n=1 Tax=Algiphilus aromaticivorans TaxID=382454 RepID=UPI0005C15D81|nr:hypothetical protein [Algiphilus aromaticivorans]
MSYDDMPERPTQPWEPNVPGPHWPEPTNADRKKALDNLIEQRMECRLASDLTSEDGRDRLFEDIHEALAGTDQLSVLCICYAERDDAEFGRVLASVLRRYHESLIGSEAIEREAEQVRNNRIAKQRREAEVERDYAADMQHQRSVDDRLDHEQENAA